MKDVHKRSLVTAKSVFFVVLSLLVFAPLAQHKTLEIIPVFHRTAEEMAEIVRPFLDQNEAVIPNRSQLILKMSAARLEEVRRLIRKLDTSPHRLMISVRQGRDLTLEALNARARVNVRIGTGRSSRSEIGVRGRYYQTESEESLGSTQNLQTLEGHPAVIKIGEQRPVANYQTYQHGDHTVVRGGIDYREATTGFTVLPRLVGEQVILNISPWSSRFDRRGGGSVDTQSADTTLRVALDEWVEIGGQAETESFNENGTLSRIRTTRNQKNRIFVKVTDLDGSLGDPASFEPKFIPRSQFK